MSMIIGIGHKFIKSELVLDQNRNLCYYIATCTSKQAFSGPGIFSSRLFCTWVCFPLSKKERKKETFTTRKERESKSDLFEPVQLSSYTNTSLVVIHFCKEKGQSVMQKTVVLPPPHAAFHFSYIYMHAQRKNYHYHQRQPWCDHITLLLYLFPFSLSSHMLDKYTYTLSSIT